MTGFTKCLYCFFLLLSCGVFPQQTANPLLEKGWAALVKDNENDAFRYFFEAYQKAKFANHTEDKAESLLYLGICSFGSSSEKGLQYATQSLGEFKKLEQANPQRAKIGRAKCLQLISTIYSRQKKNQKALQMSLEVVRTFKHQKDPTGTLGLAYSSIATLYDLQKKDSVLFFLEAAKAEFESNRNYAYLPNAYLKIGEWLVKRQRMDEGRTHFNRALHLADSTQNRQAQVSALVALGKWNIQSHLPSEAESQLLKARNISKHLSDKLFEIKSIEALIDFKKQRREFEEVSQLQKELLGIKDRYYSLEREQIAKSLEVQFEVSEKDRQLALVSKEKEVSRLTNVLLGIGIIVLIVVFSAGYFFLKRLNHRDKQLLKAKEALVEALEKQKILKEAQFRNDLEHKESQLSAITLQMLQKNELIGEIKSTIEKETQLSEQQMLKMVNKYFAQNDSWNDFDLYFESINKNFYTRLKQSYPYISANDLKICALIKLNLSIKEMASILNISHDSVKTARYRLRKKLQLNTEENLTEFILSI